LKTGEPSLSIPCHAERRYGRVMEDELLMAMPPRFLPGITDGLEQLFGNGLCCPIPPDEINNAVRAGMAVSHDQRQTLVGRGERDAQNRSTHGDA